MKSMRAQAKWRKDFVDEQVRVRTRALEKAAANKEKDPTKRAEMEEHLEEADPVAYLNAPIGWPCSDDEEDEADGLPTFKLVMQVDLPPSLAKCNNMTLFVSMLGDLPARVTAELTEMLYKKDDGSVRLPIGMLMPSPELLTEFDRMEKFMPGENSLDAFCSAGFLSKQLTRMKSVVVATEDPIQKIVLYNEYISCCGRQASFHFCSYFSVNHLLLYSLLNLTL
jgi:hypothetical protein